MIESNLDLVQIYGIGLEIIGFIFLLTTIESILRQKTEIYGYNAKDSFKLKITARLFKERYAIGIVLVIMGLAIQILSIVAPT